MLRQGVPEHVRSDNGVEMADRVRKWLASLGSQPLFIEPGSLWENGYCESFNGKLPDECVNGEIFLSFAILAFARAVAASGTAWIPGAVSDST